jgi:uncharacterized protein (DUF1499 family)
MNRLLFPFVSLAGLGAALLLLATGIGYQRGAFDLAQAYDLLRIGALLGISGAGLSIFFILWQRPLGLTLVVVTASALLGLVAFFLPYRQLLMMQQLPAIHDITTDPGNPPAFVAIARVRVSGQNPVTYDGPETAAQQRRAYPDIRSITFVQSQDLVFTEALASIEDLGWRLADTNPAEGRIEATVSSRWFGFKDDVVIRIVATPNGTVLDMRSKSRTRQHDVGANARHIRVFINTLAARLN